MLVNELMAQREARAMRCFEPPGHDDALLTAEQVACWRQVDVKTVRRDKTLPRLDIGAGQVRYRWGDLRAWLAAKKEGDNGTAE